MISLEVVDTDAFLDMPQSSQLLYFHLNARADDDGFVANPKRIMRDMGSQLDDIKLLVVKKFLISFEDGVVVIKHWRINNYIRKDIYKETKYLNHKQTLFIRPNGAYTLTDDGRATRLPRGHFQLEEIITKKGLKGLNKPQNHVHVTSTERALRIDQDRLGKVSIVKDSKEEHAASGGEQINTLLNEFKIINPTLNFVNKTQRKALESLVKQYGYEKILRTIQYAMSVQGQKYAPTITTPYQLKEKLGELKIYHQKENNQKPRIAVMPN